MNGKINDIETLRCFSIVAVILQHIDNLFPHPVPLILKAKFYLGGGFGVDLFLTISGFLIAQSLIPQLEKANTFTQKKQITIHFWYRRMWRLWPAAWVCLGAILLCVIFFNESQAFGSLAANLDATIAGFFHFANIRLYNTFMQSEYGASFVYWSLSLEEQFYFIFPILLILIPRKKIIISIILCIAIQLIIARVKHPLTIIFRTDAILLGATIYYIHQKEMHLSAIKILLKIRKIYFYFSLAFSLLVMSLITGGSIFVEYKYSYLAIISFFLVLTSSLNLNIFTPESWIKYAILWISERSYSIYLTHIPVYFFTQELIFKINKYGSLNLSNNYIYIAIAALLVPLAAHCSYQYIENPLRTYGREKIIKNQRKYLYEQS